MDVTEERRRRVRAYKKARYSFACKAYLTSVLWLLMALAQWVFVSVDSNLRGTFVSNYWISNVCFGASIFLIIVFIFMENLRFTTGLNWTLCIFTVEFIVIGLFALVVQTDCIDMVVCYCLCLMLLVLFLLVGALLPHDLTLDVVILFVLAFIFLIVTVFCILLHVVAKTAYSFFVYQFFLTITVLLFVMYHAQTINGGRFAEMRLDDFLLASLILFIHFIIIFSLTFYAQKEYRIVSKNMSSKKS